MVQWSVPGGRRHLGVDGRDGLEADFERAAGAGDDEAAAAAERRPSFAGDGVDHDVSGALPGHALAGRRAYALVEAQIDRPDMDLGDFRDARRWRAQLRGLAGHGLFGGERSRQRLRHCRQRQRDTDRSPKRKRMCATHDPPDFALKGG